MLQYTWHIEDMDSIFGEHLWIMYTRKQTVLITIKALGVNARGKHCLFSEIWDYGPHL